MKRSLAIVPALILVCARTRAAGTVELPASAIPLAAPVVFAPRLELPAPLAQLEASTLDETAIASLFAANFEVPLPASPFQQFRFTASPRAAARVRLTAAEAAQSALIPPTLWPSLSAPAADTLDWLGSRIPRLKKDAVKELGFDAVDAILSQAVARGDSALDVFTDAGLQQKGQLFYLSQDTLQKTFAKYKLYILNTVSGKAKDGRAFQLEAIVMGAGKIEMLYDRDGFEFDNPDFPDHSYRSAERVTETIQGPGDLAVEGLSVSMVMHPKIQRFLKLSSTQLRVETNWGNQDQPLKAVAVKRSARK